jgi:putative transposase
MIDSWKHCQENKELEIYGWCIMSSHIHMMVGTHGDKLEHIMRDVKKYTSLASKAAIEQHPAESRRDDETGRKKE